MPDYSLEHVKDLLNNGRRFEAFQEVEDSRSFNPMGSGFVYPADVVAAFKARKPDPEVCPDCGKAKGMEFDASRLEWLHISFCRHCREPEIQAEVEKRMPYILKNRGIAKRFHSAELSQFNKTMRDAVTGEDGAFVYGPPGVGKTHLLAAVVKHIVRNTPPVVRESGYGDYALMAPRESAYPMFMAVPELLAAIKATFGGNNGGEPRIMEDCCNTGVLLLDDIGTERGTDWALETIYLLIDRRYREMKRTIITSNLNLQQLSQRLDDRICSRIAGMCKVVQMPGKDRRLKEMK